MMNWNSLKKTDFIFMATHKCKHRHTYLEHPSCYLKDYVNNLRIGYLDIETGSLFANFSYVLSWCIKTKDENKISYGVINQNDIFSYDFDKRIIKDLINELKNFDIIITYYGTSFDIPFLRTRALSHGLVFPEFGSLKHVDVYFMVKHKLKLHKNSIESACAILNIKGKNHIKGNMWLKGVVGDSKSLKYILEHNKKDVIILEKLHNKLDKYCKPSNKSI